MQAINIDLTAKTDGYLLVARLADDRIAIHRGPNFTIVLRPAQVKKLIRHLECPTVLEKDSQDHPA